MNLSSTELWVESTPYLGHLFTVACSAILCSAIMVMSTSIAFFAVVSEGDRRRTTTLGVTLLLSIGLFAVSVRSLEQVRPRGLVGCGDGWCATTPKVTEAGDRQGQFALLHYDWLSDSELHVTALAVGRNRWKVPKDEIVVLRLERTSPFTEYGVRYRVELIEANGSARTVTRPESDRLVHPN